MIEIAIACFVILIVIFLYGVYRLMFIKENKEDNTIKTWKIGLFLTILSTIVFFVYLTTTIGAVGLEQTITDGTTDFVVQNNLYMQSFNLMPLASAIYFFQWVLLAIEVLKGVKLFGRSRMTFT